MCFFFPGWCLPFSLWFAPLSFSSERRRKERNRERTRSIRRSGRIRRAESIEELLVRLGVHRVHRRSTERRECFRETDDQEEDDGGDGREEKTVEKREGRRRRK